MSIVVNGFGGALSTGGWGGSVDVIAFQWPPFVQELDTVADVQECQCLACDLPTPMGGAMTLQQPISGSGILQQPTGDCPLQKPPNEGDGS